VQVTDDRKTIRLLSGDLDRRHHLVRAQAIDRLGSRRISRYRFRNYLFQKYLYDNLDEVERAYFHEDVGNVLEELYEGQVSEIAVQLAWHFQEAEIAEKAIHYLCQAGEKAVQLSAFQEGIAHLTRGLDLLETLPDSMERTRLEFPLQLTLGIAWQGEKGARCSEVKQAYTRARELCHQTGNTSQLCQVLGERAVFYYVGAEYHRAREHAEEALCIAHNSEDPLLVAMCHWYLGFILFSLGKFTNASAHFEQVISFYEPQTHHRQFVAHCGKDAGLGALAYNACCLWCLGYPEHALKLSQEALALARELNHPFSLADVLCFAGCLFREMRRDADALMVSAEEMMRLSQEMVPGWRGTGNSYRGNALVIKGQVQEGIEQILEGLAMMRSLDVKCYLSGFLSSLAEAQAKAGQLDEAQETFSEALTLIEETNERYWEAELYRLWGELLFRQGNEAEAEVKLQKAIKIAQSQSARSWELRATTSLARLWQKQGKKDEARQVMEMIFSWFTEGFNAPDLKEAKALLNELS
jgi:predicted ATPase